LTYIWRNLLLRKVRTGLSMLGVAVSVAGIVSLISVALGMKGSFDQYLEESGAALVVFKSDVADLIFSSVKTAEIEAIRAMDGVEAVARTNLHMARPPSPAPLPVIFCFGRYPEERLMEKYRDLLVAGRLFQRRDEIVAAKYIARKMRWKIGEKVTLLGREFTVVGLYEPDIPWENGILVHAGFLAEQLGRKDSYSIVFVYATPATRDAVKREIEEKLPNLTAVPPSDLTKRFAEQLQIIDDFIIMITVIALVVGVLGVLNTMMMSVSERTREIGMLRALGWSKGRVVMTILIEGVLLSILGGALGLVLGVLGTEALVSAFEDAFLVSNYEFSTFVKGAVVALIVGVLAALYPALRAAGLKPVEALRYE
jgi:putative ABC transport system permease protein